MKRIIIAVLLCASAHSSHAQAPVLNALNINPFLGDIYVNNICDTTGVDAGPGGPSQTWSFTGLNPATSGTTIDTATAEACSSTATCAAFAGSNIAIVTPTASTIEYVSARDTALQQVGYYNSPTQNAIYSDPILQFRYPFTYLSSFTDPCAGVVTYTPSGGPTIVATEASTVTTTADGWGKLTLPGPISYPSTLRVHSTQTFRDSANLFGTPVVETYQLETYTWYTPGYHSPLLTIATASGLYNYKVVSYSAKKLKTEVPVIDNKDLSVFVYPNPASDIMNVQVSVTGSDRVRVSLSDMMGRETAVMADKEMQGKQQLAYNTSALPRGLYIVRVATGGTVATRQVSIQ